MAIIKENCHISLFVKKNKYTILNGNNYIGRRTRIKSTIIGRHSYIGNDSDLSNCIIGSFCSIGSNVSVVNGFHPTSNFVSTHPAFYSNTNSNLATFVSSNKFPEYRFASEGKYVQIGNDCWIGNNVIILAGVKVGNGAVIGAGAVVTKDVDDYAVCVGVPAKIKKFRFKEEQIKFLLKIKWWEKDDEWLIQHSDLFENIKNFEEGVNK